MSKSNQTPRTSRLTSIAVVAIATVLIVFVLWKADAATKKMSSAMASDEQILSHFRPGDTAKFVEEVSDANGNGILTGIVLNKKTDDLYLRTSQRATLHWNNQTKIVMGKSDDLHPGAVIHVTASAQQDHSFTAQQLVILTGYVKV